MENKFTITPKKTSKSITITLRIDEGLNNKLEKLALQSNYSRNKLINMALEFAFNNFEFKENKNNI